MSANAVQPVFAHIAAGRSSGLAAWDWGLLLLPAAAVLLWWYGRGVLRLWRRAGVGHGIERWREPHSLPGVVCVCVALVGPMDNGAARSFALHMTQHDAGADCRATHDRAGHAGGTASRRRSPGCARRRGAVATYAIGPEATARADRPAHEHSRSTAGCCCSGIYQACTTRRCPTARSTPRSTRCCSQPRRSRGGCCWHRGDSGGWGTGARALRLRYSCSNAQLWAGCSRSPPGILSGYANTQALFGMSPEHDQQVGGAIMGTLAAAVYLRQRQRCSCGGWRIAG